MKVEFSQEIRENNIEIEKMTEDFKNIHRYWIGSSAMIKQLKGFSPSIEKSIVIYSCLGFRFITNRGCLKRIAFPNIK